MASITKDKLCIVQFMHSGNEFPVLKCKRTIAPSELSKSRFHVYWSAEPSHYRRLIQHCGCYVDKNGNYLSAPLAFWSEWEAETIAERLHPNKDFFKANFIHHALNPMLMSGTGVCGCGTAAKCPLYLNTDPCLFGSTFKYSNCHQSKFGDLRRLAPGSLIVFGSYKKIAGCQPKEVFCLDTVFVVDDIAVDYATDNVNAVPCSEKYKNLTLLRLPMGENFTFYRGATCHSSVTLNDALFSFTPAKLVGDGDAAYKRCVIEDIEVLNRHLRKPVFYRSARQGFHAEVADMREIKAVWKKIVNLVTYGDNFVLGVHFDWPTRRKENNHGLSTGKRSDTCSAGNTGQDTFRQC